MCILWQRLCRPLEKLMNSLKFGALAAALLLVPTLAIAATPPPAARIDVSKLQPTKLLPKTRVHTEFVVEINRLGQVTRVRSGKSSKDASFNAQTYGNALQAFIRTPDGQVVVGTYKLSYDFDPTSKRVHRDVEFVSAGGVNPNAVGAAAAMEVIAKKRADAAAKKTAHTTPRPQASVDDARLPDLNNVMKASPAPK